MAGTTGDDRPTRLRGERGHRAVPHTADVRIEAWGTSREQCLAEAVLGMVESFADLSRAEAHSVRQLRVTGSGDEDLLATLLDEVVFRLEVHGEVPVHLRVEAVGEVLDVRAAVTDLGRVPVTGAPPKGVSFNELRLAPDPYGWSCAVTVDV
ncbi:archease [Streptomyces smyrnaeus]|uniref:Archease n=1 Tax=Streptomyces smyrnaeus TaxID=1387713 RepID=A0ABS3Y6U6_9ACTN|nr:archease [Streptomyces smyrnaeus]MBO8203389.1 archease [Streptomyces smyrnaeus]